ncbi:MAG: hypothetical protein NTW93_07095, partial [Phycisphaerae bacterium]|nr:hypothetical protein [Phycisphaerae bacterium]
TVGWSWPITSSGGTINNAGLFRKSAGTGTATIDSTYFNNTGTVEVDSGTLSLYQLNNSGSVNVYGTALNVTNGGSSVDRHYEFTNGGRLNGSLTWQGENTANGNGVLAVGGNVAAGTTAKFASSQFTNGAQLEVGSGYSNKLNVETGSTLMLDMTGSQQATMVSGMIDGDGTTINTGNFAFSGGQIGRYGTGSFINQGNFTWTGGSTGGNGGIANQNNITISGNGNQTIGYCIDAGWGYFAPGALTNSGTITHAADGVLHMVKDSTLNNLAGAVYDLPTSTTPAPWKWTTGR